MRIFYFYGFASGPLSSKAIYFQKKFQYYKNIDFQIIDYISNQEKFSNMKISDLIKTLHLMLEEFEKNSIVLFGSSFGALISLWLATLSPHKVNRVILMAPALKLTPKFFLDNLNITESEWKTKNFVLMTHYRYSHPVPLNYSFYEDLNDNPIPCFDKLDSNLQILIFHGKYDKTCPIVWSKELYFKHPKNISLEVLESDHQLLNQKEIIWNKIKEFFRLNDQF